MSDLAKMPFLMQPSPTLYLALGLVLEIYWLVIRDQLELRLMRVFLIKNKTKQTKYDMKTSNSI